MSAKLTFELAKQIAQFMVSRGMLTEQGLYEALEQAKVNNTDLVDHLVEQGLLTEAQITKELSDAYALDVAELSHDNDVDIDALESLPKQFMIQHRVLPFALEEGQLYVAISEPDSLQHMPNITLITGLSVRTFVTQISVVNNWLERINQLDEDASFKTLAELDARVVDSDDLDDEAKSAEVIQFVDQVIGKAIHLGVSDIHLEPYSHKARLRYRLDGVLIDQTDKGPRLFEFYNSIITRIKILASLNIAERRLPQDGAITYETRDLREIDIRVSILPTKFGERVVMRILDHSAFEPRIENLGFREDDEARFKKAIDQPQGLVLVTGPTGSGKSTTLYAALHRLNRDDVNIMTAEDPVENVMEGVGQVQIKENIGLTFTAALRSFLRQDPEIILVGEIRDRDTADIAIKSSLTGHLVLSTLHTNDAISTVTRLINMGVPAYLITASLTLVVAQRLARKNCPDCLVVDESVTDEHLKIVGFTPEDAEQFPIKKGQGCSSCNNTGYKGRQGVYEILSIDPELREAILNGENAATMLEIAQRNGFSTMQEVARGFLKSGILSSAEYQRVFLV